MKHPQLLIGWSHIDITPDQPVMLRGQFFARISEGVMDPVTATAVAFDNGEEQAVMVSVDIVTIADSLRDAVRGSLGGIDGLDPSKVILIATHTHAAPSVAQGVSVATLDAKEYTGVGLEAWGAQEYDPFLAERLAKVISDAWQARTPGSFAFGLGQEIIGRNRRWKDTNGVNHMYGNIATDTFDHIEGYEDQNVNILATYDASGELSGLIINLACPSQVDEGIFQISADYWHEVRHQVREAFGDHVHVAGQCSAAGDQAPQRIDKPRPVYTYDKWAEQRMAKLRGQTERQQIAARIVRSLKEVLPVIEPTRSSNPLFFHVTSTIELPLNALDEKVRTEAQADYERYKQEFETELQRINNDPTARQQPRWYVNVTRSFGLMRRFEDLIQRCDSYASGTHTTNTEIHVLRLGDMAFATNAFEYYLDFGIQIKARSPAVQTFIVQLAGQGSYIPSFRSVQGGGYGSVPASNPVGPEGGCVLRDETLTRLEKLFANTDT